MGDPHDWNSWDHYRTIHDRRLEEHPFVQDHDLEWEVIEGETGAVLITLQGLIVCRKGVHVRVWKLLTAIMALTAITAITAITAMEPTTSRRSPLMHQPAMLSLRRAEHHTL